MPLNGKENINRPSKPAVKWYDCKIDDNTHIPLEVKLGHMWEIVVVLLSVLLSC